MLKTRRIPQTICHRNYKRILPIIEACDRSGEYIKIENEPYMALSVDFLREETNGSKIYSLAHNFIQNGDVMADPDMEIRISHDMKMAEALTYQLDSLGIYQQVYLPDGRFYPDLKKKLNIFLCQWLNTLKDQGFMNINTGK